MNHSDGLDTNIRFLKGVGPQRAKFFEKAGICTVGQLIDFFPNRYRFFGKITRIANLKPARNAVIIGQIESIRWKYGRQSRVIVDIRDESGWACVRWFNSNYLREKLKVGQWIKVAGKVSYSYDDTVFTNPQIQFLTSPENDSNEINTQPVYPAIKGIYPRTLAYIVGKALESFGKYIEEWHSSKLLNKNHLLNIKQAYKWIHQPKKASA